MPHARLMRGFSRKMNKRVFNEILSTMLESGEIVECNSTGEDLDHGEKKYYR